MITILASITKNTFTDTIRQPVYAIIIIASLFLFILAPSISMYTLDEDVKLLRELGLSTLFIAGLFIAVFSSTGAITEEIESKTITTILTKPVERPIFILGKFFGVSLAVLLAHFINTVAYLLAARHGVLETVSDEMDMPVIVAGACAILIAVTLSAFLNYTYEWNFSASAIVLFALFEAVAVIFLLFVDKEWKFGPFIGKFNIFDVYASALLLFGILILVALAVLFSTRMNIVFTLTLCIAVFFLGLISDWVASEYATKYLWAKLYTIALPNLQIFWVSDAIYEKGSIPFSYILNGLSYSTCYIGAVLALAIASFQTRQVG